MAEGDTLINALLGAIATAVLTPLVPFAPVLGGLLAGYLEGGDRNSGLRVGTISGVVALIPLVLLAVLLGNILVLFVSGMAGMPRFVGGLGIFFVVVGLVVAVVYTVGLSGLGGWLGNYVRYETDIGR